MKTEAKDLFNSFVEIESHLSEIYMRLAALTEESDFVRTFDRAYYESVEHKHAFIALRKMVCTTRDFFSEEFFTEAAALERLMGNLFRVAKHLEKSGSYHDLASQVIDAESQVKILYEKVALEAWELEKEKMSAILLKKEKCLSEMSRYKKSATPEQMV